VEKENLISFDEAKHEYKITGSVVPGVTSIIKEITGTQWNAAEWYLTRGKAIHACAALIAQGKEFKFDERLAGYITALRKFFSEVKPEFNNGSSEKNVYSLPYLFAGTVDLICNIGNRKVLIDYKHSIDIERLKWQLGGYSQAYKDQSKIEINHGCGVEIRENGTYSMTPIFDLRKLRGEFLAMRTVYGIKERLKQLSFQKGE
jgi:hypothetical protein